jgi:Flp pilus assembly protein TadB
MPIAFYFLNLLMLPDYPHKLFTDNRGQFNLLMETLAMDSL